MRAFLRRYAETLRVALDALGSRRLRTALTISGVVVGVAVAVLVASLLRGMQRSFVQLATALAPDVVRVEKASFQDFPGDGQAFVEAVAKRPDLLTEDLLFLRERLGAAVEVGAQADASLPVRRGGRTLTGVFVQGVTANIASLSTVRVARGREVNEADDAFRRPVCVVGADVAADLFPSSDPLGQELRVGRLPYTVVGVAEARGASFGQSQDGFVQMPLGAFTKVFGRRAQSLVLLARARAGSGLGVEEVEERVRASLRLRHRLPPGAEDDFSVVTARSAQAFIDSFTAVLGAALVPLTAVALAVSGVVVMNMMLASVTERTREIGIRMAVGARRRDILTQFLVEATLLTLLGGLAGLCVATLLTWALGLLTGIPASPPLWAAVAAVAVSCAVGITFGVVPARRAARLDPVEALRAE